MLDYILERTIKEAEYILDNLATLRVCAKMLGVSKSTVHSDINERLPLIDKELYKAVKKVLENNYSERHIRGGMSTRQKYIMTKKLL